MALPAAVLHAFGCLSSWYPARSLGPAGQSSVRPLIAAVGATAVAAAVVAGAAHATVRALGLARPGIEARWGDGTLLVGAAAALVYVCALAFHAALGALDGRRRAEALVWETRSLAREAELRALRAQVDPHFLYNSLAAIGGMVRVDPDSARGMCVALADFLRRSLRSHDRGRIPLAEELALVERYLEIEAIRLGDRLRVERRIDPEALDVAVPPLILQPLVENAVRHGIAPLLEGGTLRLEARSEGARVRVRVVNDLDPDHGSRSGGGIGLRNVRSRLEATWGGDASLRVERAPELFTVEIELPADAGEAAA